MTTRRRVIALAWLVLGTATLALAAAAVDAPEIDAGSFASGFALVSGGLLVMRGRRR